MASEDLTAKAKESTSTNRLLDNNGFWGAIGALLGALIGGLFSFQAAAITISAESERSRQSFFLTERVDAYSRLIETAQAFQLSATRYRDHADRNGMDSAAAQAALADAQSDYDEAVSAAWRVEIMGTGRVWEAKQIMAEELDEAMERLTRFTQDDAAYFHGLNMLMTRHTSSFSDAAREDLQPEQSP